MAKLIPVNRVRAMNTAAMDQRAFVIRHTPFVCYGRISSPLAIGKTLR
jgi:hypothetical protein